VSTPSDLPRDGAPEASRRTKSRFLTHFLAADSYALVLLFIILSYVLAVGIHGSKAPSIVLFVQIVTVWFALRTSRAHRIVLAVAGSVLVAAGAVALVGLFTGTPTRPLIAVFIMSAVLYTIAPVSIVRHIAFREAVDRETMLGAISAYLLIGMAYAFFYLVIGRLADSAFFGAKGDGSPSQVLFFSFTTLSTTGYGNLVPAGQPGQSLAVSEMILGQLFLITAVGKIVTAWRPRGWRRGEGNDAGPGQS
jgi:hypothetical protein